MVTITKVGSTQPSLGSAHPTPTPTPKSRRSKTTKTYPKGILKKTSKINPVKDPAKSPPLQKGVRKHTVRVLTEKGVGERRKTIRKKIREMKDDDVKNKLKRSGMTVNEKTPPHILREMLEGGTEAGMISLQ